MPSASEFLKAGRGSPQDLAAVLARRAGLGFSRSWKLAGSSGWLFKAYSTTFSPFGVAGSAPGGQARVFWVFASAAREGRSPMISGRGRTTSAQLFVQDLPTGTCNWTRIAISRGAGLIVVGLRPENGLQFFVGPSTRSGISGIMAEVVNRITQTLGELWLKN